MRKIAPLILLLTLPLVFRGQDTMMPDMAIRMALVNNYSILIAKNNASVAANNNNIGNAGFLPTADVSAGYQENIINSNQKYFDGRERTGSNAKSSSLNAAAGLDWTLFDGMAMFTNKAKLAELEKMGETEARMTIENTVGAVILNYYALVQLERMVEVLARAIDISVERKRLAELKLRLGSGSDLELLQAIVDMHADSAQLIQQQSQIRSLKIELNKLLVRNVETPFQVAGRIPYSDTLNYKVILQQTLSQNPSLQQARHLVQLAKLDIRQAQSALYPHLGVYAGYSYSGSQSASGFTSENTSYGWNYGASISMNLFDGLRNLNNIRNARIDFASSELNLKQIEQDISGDVLRLFNDYRTALMLVAFEEANLDIARENTRIALEKYQLGAMNDLDLRTIQQKQLDAERRLLTAQFEAKGKETELRVISGTLLTTVAGN